MISNFAYITRKRLSNTHSVSLIGQLSCILISQNGLILLDVLRGTWDNSVGVSRDVPRGTVFYDFMVEGVTKWLNR